MDDRGREGMVALNARSDEPTPKPATRDYQLYAISSYNAMQRYFYTSYSLYKENYPRQTGDRAFSYNWPFYSAMAATLDVYGLPAIGTSYKTAVKDRMIGLARYWDAEPSYGLPGYSSYVVRPLGSGGDKYNDDNVVSALNLIRVYRMTNNATALTQAKRTFDFIVSSWDTKATCAPGGIFWKQQKPTETDHVRATNATALGAELALRLYQVTSQQLYLDWGVRLFNWVDAYMYDRSDGMYWNSIDDKCVINYPKWSYNQGAMIGANVLLCKIKGEVPYVTKAEKLTAATLRYYGDVAGWYSQDPAFNAMYFKNALMLSAVSSNAALKANIVQAMQGYANSTWDDVSIRQSSNLFYFKPGHAWLLQQGGMIQIYAALNWRASRYDLLF